eukprot:1157686-Pelagomonas_calceolata.AAC.2
MGWHTPHHGGEIDKSLLSAHQNTHALGWCFGSFSPPEGCMHQCGAVAAIVHQKDACTKVVLWQL